MEDRYWVLGSTHCTDGCHNGLGAQLVHLLEGNEFRILTFKAKYLKTNQGQFFVPEKNERIYYLRRLFSLVDIRR